uniref:C2H2-type domain-containing protein n=2 Tax=Rhizophagus irregularis (strain DAOM 181602 / DAOM 197198 / MUCL 43194) TaxID=747089 RepID=U9SZH0_RHIID
MDIKSLLNIECEHCHKLFKNKHAIKQHLKTHIRPHKCTVCDKDFAQRNHLEIHNRTHNAERPYACNLCTWKFYDPDTLKRHLKYTHSEDKPHVCECGSSYKRVSSLGRHQRKCILLLYKNNFLPNLYC